MGCPHYLDVASASVGLFRLMASNPSMLTFMLWMVFRSGMSSRMPLVFL
jgi:hypothetical protein